MNTKLLLVFAFASVVSSHDISIGSDAGGRKIFDEIRQANPAIWRQIENVTIIAPNGEVISRVVVTDMRPEKDGEVQIVDGGDGRKSVTIELKSPTVLRGYEFHLEVYTVPDTKLTDAEEHLYLDPTSTTDKIDMPDTSEATSHEADGSGDEDKTKMLSEMSSDADKTTELPESTTYQDIPALVGKVVDGDILRPARETSDENNSPQISQSEENLNVHPSLIGSEDDLTTTENVSTEITTEADMTTKLDDSEQITVAPGSFDNSKNIPDYPSLSILDYIKSKEGARQSRRTDETNDSNDDATTTEKIDEKTDSVDISYMLPTEKPISPLLNNNDDTVDLVPPEKTDYNTGFSSNNENTEIPVVEISSNNGPRAGRGLDFEDSQELFTPTTMSAVELTTSVINNEDSENSTTEATIDEQSRNARETDVDENVNGLDTSNQNEQIPLCRAANENDKPSNNLTPNMIIVNGEQLTLTPDSNHKMQFGIPIILIIGSDTNIPTIKIIAEGASDNENKNVNMEPLAENPMDDYESVPEDKLNYSQKREFPDEFIPKSVMSFK
ncbi:uncharacterized protein LOC126777641 [Nymphalis io]|uniref:uncharacterized protein LOC126777641 n=1 Tax=Inachis io TaxID=171585 RepID=UPI002169B56E|nr:uncharacterized protein LOC126777641 [Nymphalis io]